jgi:hypothetical protein
MQPGQTIIGGSFETVNGKLTGILVDNAGDIVAAKIPYPSKKKWNAG